MGQGPIDNIVVFYVSEGGILFLRQKTSFSKLV